MFKKNKDTLNIALPAMVKLFTDAHGDGGQLLGRSLKLIAISGVSV